MASQGVQAAASKVAGKGVGAAVTSITGGNAAAGRIAGKATEKVTAKHGKKIAIVAGIALLLGPAVSTMLMVSAAAGAVVIALGGQQLDSMADDSFQCLDPESSDTSISFEGLSFAISPEQTDVAATIVKVGEDHDIPEFGLQVALATALQESTLRNLAEGDRDSVGVFQQRPSTGWGTVDEIRDVRKSAEAFYGVATHTSNRGLLNVEGWQDMALTVAAQAVQSSGFPDAYAKWEPDATILVAGLSGTECTLGVATIYGDMALPLPAGSWTFTSAFNPRRSHPVSGEIRPHNGADLGAPAGTPIFAVADGVVSRVLFNPAGAGHAVWIDHGGGVSTAYFHMVTRPSVYEGDRVEAGDQIGGVGDTGNSDGNHLHLEYLVNGVAVDPVPVLAAVGIDLCVGRTTCSV